MQHAKYIQQQYIKILHKYLFLCLVPQPINFLRGMITKSKCTYKINNEMMNCSDNNFNVNKEQNEVEKKNLLKHEYKNLTKFLKFL